MNSPLNVVGDLRRDPLMDPNPVPTVFASACIEKGRRLSLPLLELAGPVADPAIVVSHLVQENSDRLYGNFMLTWLDNRAEPRVVNHIPDASFFLQLLDLCYAPVFARSPELRSLLTGASRPEMSLTNDVLQIQLRTDQESYSMVRHHALMLFYAALWLAEPERTAWLSLYDQLVTYVDERPEGRPSLEQIATIERGAFEDFEALSSRTLNEQDARQLLKEPKHLRRILDHQLYAATAIGLLWREYRVIPRARQDEWHHEQLSSRLVRPDYLENEWVTQR